MPTTFAESSNFNSKNQNQEYTNPSTTSTKTFQTSNSNASNVHQTCIVSSPSNTPVSKEYRIPQAPSRSIFLNSPAPPISRSDKTPNRSTPANFVPPQTKQQSSQQQQQQQIQTKAQTKIYPELSNQSERQRNSEEPQSQSSPISYSIMDAPGRLHYSGSNSSSKTSGRNSVQVKFYI